MPTDNLIFTQFNNFISDKVSYEVEGLLGISNSTFKRYKSGKQEIPKTIILLINKINEVQALKKDINNLVFEREGMKQSYKNYLSAKKSFEEAINE